MKSQNFLLQTICCVLVFSTTCNAQYNYPPTKTVDSSDTYFGVTYKDPYRWLENMKDTTVISWFKQEANFTNNILNKIPGRDKLIAEWKMLDKLQPPKIILQYYKNGRLFYLKQMPGEKVMKLYYRVGMNGKEILLFDPMYYIKGKTLQGGEVYLTANVSSQFVSALIMIAPCMENGLTLHLEREVISKPYIHLTQKMMEEYGVRLKWTGDKINVHKQSYVSIPYYVEPDWSAASYWYALVALVPDAEVKLVGLRKNSLQGDANIVNLFADLGVETFFDDDIAL